MVDTFDGNPEARPAVIEACCEPGASAAGIAMANSVRINELLPHRWLPNSST
jgi:hypothetical protein